MGAATIKARLACPKKRCLMLAARVHLASSFLHVHSSAEANTTYDACRALAKPSEPLGILSPSRLAAFLPRYLAFPPAPISRARPRFEGFGTARPLSFWPPSRQTTSRMPSEAESRRPDLRPVAPPFSPPSFCGASLAASPALPPLPQASPPPLRPLHLPDSARRMVSVVAT